MKVVSQENAINQQFNQQMQATQVWVHYQNNKLEDS